MTLTQLQSALHSLYAGDTNTPDSSSAEWTVRTALINAAINAWENEYGVFWNELYTTLTDAATGDKTVNASDLIYGAPTNFKFLAGYVETYSDSAQRTKWAVKHPEKFALKRSATVVGLDEGYVYITGNASSGYVINFSSQPTSGDTIDYPYYKLATSLSSGSDVIEMVDPYFAVYFALSKLHEQDGEGDRAEFAMSQAMAKLDTMKTLNAQLPHYQMNQVEDSELVRTSQGFGT